MEGFARRRVLRLATTELYASRRSIVCWKDKCSCSAACDSSPGMTMGFRDFASSPPPVARYSTDASRAVATRRRRSRLIFFPLFSTSLRKLLLIFAAAANFSCVQPRASRTSRMRSPTVDIKPPPKRHHRDCSTSEEVRGQLVDNICEVRYNE